jgi:hypothetical protein
MTHNAATVQNCTLSKVKTKTPLWCTFPCGMEFPSSAQRLAKIERILHQMQLGHCDGHHLAK